MNRLLKAWARRSRGYLALLERNTCTIRRRGARYR
jgi:hypothetical protein